MSTPALLTDAMSEVGRAFKQMLAAHRRLRASEIRCHGELSDAQYGLLFSLLFNPEMSARELAYQADLSPASVAEMLESLTAAGLVQRHRSESDRRVVLTSLTDRGQDLVQRRREQYEPRWRAALSEFSEEQLLSAAAVLDRLRRMFEEFAEERAVNRD